MECTGPFFWSPLYGFYYEPFQIRLHLGSTGHHLHPRHFIHRPPRRVSRSWWSSARSRACLGVWNHSKPLRSKEGNVVMRAVKPPRNQVGPSLYLWRGSVSQKIGRGNAKSLSDHHQILFNGRRQGSKRLLTSFYFWCLDNVKLLHLQGQLRATTASRCKSWKAYLVKDTVILGNCTPLPIFEIFVSLIHLQID
jgi:hypothetical protein